MKTGFDVTVLANCGGNALQLSAGSLVVFNMLSRRVAQPILRLSQLWQGFQHVRISVDRLGDIVNTPAEPEYPPTARACRRSKG